MRSKLLSFQNSSSLSLIRSLERWANFSSTSSTVFSPWTLLSRVRTLTVLEFSSFSPTTERKQDETISTLRSLPSVGCETFSKPRRQRQRDYCETKADVIRKKSTQCVRFNILYILKPTTLHRQNGPGSRTRTLTTKYLCFFLEINAVHKSRWGWNVAPVKTVKTFSRSPNSYEQKSTLFLWISQRAEFIS